MKKIAVSACLLGVNCRYDGGNCLNLKVKTYLLNKEYLLLCPEELGGLGTPRLPAELTADKILNSQGQDVSLNFIQGANKALDLALAAGCELAILKSESPSCGNKYIYDGSFSGRLIKGQGITAKLFESFGIKVINEEDL